MRRKQITSLLLSSILALSAMATPFTQLPVYAAEAEIDAVESEESGTDASDEDVGEADGGNQMEGIQPDETGASSGESSENGNSGTIDGETVADTAEDEGSGEVSNDDNTGDNIEAADDEETVKDSEVAAGETKDEADGDFIFSGVVSATTEGQDFIPEEKGGESPDDLFADYVEKSFNGELNKESSLEKRGAKSAGSNLSGIDRAIYNNISACLPQIAAGERASTVFEISVDELGLEKTAWTAEELGIVSVLTLDEDGNIALDDNGYASISPEAVDAVSERTAFDLTKITRALLADNPYQLYWYEKTQSTTATGFQLTASYDNAIGDYLVGPVGSMEISFPVANEYSAGEYMVDTTIGQAVQTSVANANAIVSQYSSATDYDKLNGYKDEICDLVSYNEAAAGGGVSYGNPWQMIWVFDQDPTTNVVCEGYAKAFKYLCDQSDFSGDISCITVTGTMSGGTGEGPHMWNVVNMQDGKNYLVDVTNSDSGTIGENGELFLTIHSSGDYQEGYTFECGTNDEIHYAYDENTLSVYSSDDLTIGEVSVTPDPLEIIVQPEDITAEAGQSVSLHVEANANDATYQWQWSEAGFQWEDCTCEGYNTDTITFVMEEDHSGRIYRCVVTRGNETVYSNSARITLDNQQEIEVQGLLGFNITWTLDYQGNLTVKGSGSMFDYDKETIAPIGYYSDLIKHIYISDGITHIGDYVFFNQYSVKEAITIPESVLTIGDHAFSECGATGFVLPEGLVSIGEYAFKQSGSFKEITIPESVQEIGAHAFDYCLGLESVDIRGNISRISEGLFLDCVYLNSVILPDSITEIGDNAFKGCQYLTNLDLPDSVVSIGEYSFAGDIRLELLKLSQNLTEIGPYAFSNTAISEITIPDGVTTIPEHAFDRAASLSRIIIPEGLSEIEAGAFNGCTSLKVLNIPESVSSIGDGAFLETCTLLVVNGSFAQTWAEANNHPYIIVSDEPTELMAEGTCGDGVNWKLYWNGKLSIYGNGTISNTSYTDYQYYIRTVEIGSGITQIPTDAFYNCPYLISIEISEDNLYYKSENGVAFSKDMTTLYSYPRAKEGNYSVPVGVTKIGGYSFYKCSDLTGVSFPESITRIGATAFAHCSGLTELQIPDSVYIIDASAFIFCENLVEIMLPQNCQSLKGSTFEGCKSLERVDLPNSIRMIGFRAFADCSSLVNVTMPQELDELGKEAFFGCSALTEITVPEGVETLYENTFRQCSDLASISLPSTLCRIENCVFRDCNSLQSIVIPSSVTSIGLDEFANCYSLESVVLPNGLTEIPENCFWKCKKLTDISIPEHVVKIFPMAFAGCESIEVLELPDGLEEIGHSCFSGCEGLNSISIPDSVTTIPGGLFIECRELQSVHLPDGLTSIPNETFRYCESLKSCDIPDTVTYIGTMAFSHCYSLESIQLPSALESIGEEAFCDCKKLHSIDIPEGIDTISYCCFYRCYLLESIKLPTSLKQIGGWAFNECRSLSEVLIPNGTESIGERAFQNCGSLEKVYIPESVNSIGNQAFAGSEIVSIYGDSESGAMAFANNSHIPFIPVMDATNSHVYIEWETVKTPTCTEAGSRKKSCAFCGEEVTEEIPATGHAWSEWIVVREATEEEEGLERRTCSNDPSHTEERTIPTLTHVHELIKTEAIEATCTEAGNMEFWTCSDCGRVYSDSEGVNEVDPEETVVHATGHRWNTEYTVDREATCTEKGSESIHCSVCGVSDENTTRTIPKKGHSYGDWTVAKEATCTEAGSKEKVCASCGDKITEEIPATGHSYGDWTVTKEATCTENGSREKVCANCGDKVTEEITAIGHLWDADYTIDKEATCIEDGAQSIHCSVCGESDESSVGIIPATGHSYGEWTVTKDATCTENGSREKVCANCGDKITEEIPATGHAYGDWAVTKEATCTENGSKEKVCANCGDKVTEEIPATGHAWSEWTVVREATEEEEGLERRTCSNDPSHTEERTIPKLAHVHNLTKTEAKEASCTVDGNVEFWTCSKCGKVYSDGEGMNEVSIEETIIHATGHEWNTEYTVDKEATCTEEGSESIHCSVCGESDENSVQVIPATGHSYGEWTVVREATCTEAGSKEKVCASCGDKVTEEIPATGHAYGEWTVTKEATCTENGRREKVCAVCGFKVTEEILSIGHVWNSDYSVDTEATCTEEGSESIHCSVCGVSDENTVRVIPAKGHSYGEWTVVRDATCTEAGSKEKVCASCGDKVTEKIPATGHAWSEWTVVREATCTEDGSREKVCGNCGDKITEEIPATGHEWSEWTVVREATEEEEGLERRTCSNDPSHTEERTIPKLTHVHELTKTEAKEASCTEDGNIEFWTCSKCGRVYSDSEGVDEINLEETVIHAVGHKWNTEHTVDKEATCTEEGSESIHCSVCDAINETTVRAIAKTEHAYGDWTITKEATCTEDGSREKVCANCGDKVTETIAATGHAYGDWTVTKEATCTEDGSKEKVCTNCGDKITEEIPATGHEWSEWTVVREATEEEEGLERRTCSNDPSHTEERTIPKLTHVHELTKTEAKEASCTEDGNIEFWTCSKCGRVYSDSEGVDEINPEETVIHAVGHKWNTEYTVDKEATCTEEGSESIHCSVCDAINETTVRVIPKTEHEYGDWTVTKEATCTEDGSREKVCANCGDKITETISATGHVWEDEYTVDKEATCTEEGSESIHCSVCDAINETTVRVIPKTEHEYGDWTVTKEATCTEGGSREKVCANCGDKVTETIAATGHAYGDWTVTKEATCTEDGSKEKVCTNCGNKVTETILTIGHVWEDEYTVDKEATYTEEGSESIHCSVCDAINESTVRPIPVLKATWKQDRNGWWYDRGDGTYPKDGFEEIKGVTYCFDASGYMKTGWVQDDGAWYYFAASGAMVKDNWQQSGSTWYYFGDDGKMLTGLQEINGTSYFFETGGAMATGWQQIDGDWYFFAGSGAMVKKNWQQSSSTWYYFGEDGKMLTGLQEINGKSYFFKDGGAMASGWQEIDGDWYYFDASGAMVKENWQQSGNTWYYFDGEGKMLTGLQEIGGRIYFFKDSGAMVTGWQQVGDDWYYFESSGAAACSKWVGNYYMLNSGVMATNQWVDNDRYYVGADGLWIQGYVEPN